MLLEEELASFPLGMLVLVLDSPVPVAAWRRVMRRSTGMVTTSLGGDGLPVFQTALAVPGVFLPDPLVGCIGFVLGAVCFFFAVDFMSARWECMVRG